MNISIDDLESMLKSHSDSENIYYERLETTDGKFVFDTSKPLDKDGKPLANPEIVDGIELREVNKAKGV